MELKNQRIIDTNNGNLLIRKGSEDGELTVRFSSVFEKDGVFIEPTVTMSFDNEYDRDIAYNVSEDECKGLLESLLNSIGTIHDRKEVKTPTCGYCDSEFSKGTGGNYGEYGEVCTNCYEGLS